ncbi:MAG: cytoplasmic protein [Deltaproteobacteria bacterium]|nr:cytoplasmic protein [Deltaproteobacteria bacterium]
MTEKKENEQINLEVDEKNFYREEGYTDMKVASIRKLVPVSPDGTKDESRIPIFIGATQLISPQGPLPVQAILSANNLQEAIAVFPESMQKAMEELMQRMRKMQEEEKAKNESRIVMP